MERTTTSALEEFCAKTSTRTGLTNARGKYRHVTEAFATLGWFARVSASLRRNLEPASIDRRFAELLPQVFSPAAASNNPLRRRRLLRSWRAGQHTPGPNVIAAVDAKLPGTGAAFRHVFFEIADHTRNVSADQAAWRSRLRPMDQILFLTAELIWDCPYDLREIRRTSTSFAPALDALAADLLAVRLAQSCLHDDLAFLNALWFAQALVLHWDYLVDLGFSEALVDYLNLAYFSKARSLEGWSVAVDCVALRTARANMARIASCASLLEEAQQPARSRRTASSDALPPELLLTCLPAIVDVHGRTVGLERVKRVLGHLRRSPVPDFITPDIKVHYNFPQLLDRFEKAYALKSRIRSIASDCPRVSRYRGQPFQEDLRTG